MSISTRIKLKRYRFLKIRIAGLEADIKELEDMAGSVKGVSYGERLASNRSQEAPFEELVFRIQEKEKTKQKLRLELLREADEVEAVIAAIEDERVKAIFEYHYLRAWTFEAIAREMSYSVERIYQLHREEIRRLEEESEEEDEQIH